MSEFDKNPQSIYNAEMRDTPEWRERARGIKEHDNYTCQYCGKKAGQALDVHHLFYHYRVWEAPDHALVTLCHDTCHQKDGDYVWTQKSPVPGRPGVFQQTGKIGPYFDTLLLLAHEFRNRGISIRRLMAFARLIPQLTEGQWQDIVRYIPAEEETQSEDDAAFAEYMNSRGQA